MYIVLFLRTMPISCLLGTSPSMWLPHAQHWALLSSSRLREHKDLGQCSTHCGPPFRGPWFRDRFRLATRGKVPVISQEAALLHSLTVPLLLAPGAHLPPAKVPVRSRFSLVQSHSAHCQLSLGLAHLLDAFWLASPSRPRPRCSFNYPPPMPHCIPGLSYHRFGTARQPSFCFLGHPDTPTHILPTWSFQLPLHSPGRWKRKEKVRKRKRPGSAQPCPPLVPGSINLPISPKGASARLPRSAGPDVPKQLSIEPPGR